MVMTVVTVMVGMEVVIAVTGDADEGDDNRHYDGHGGGAIDIVKAADGASDNENNYHFLLCVPQGFSQISLWFLGSLSSALYTSQQRLLQEVLPDQPLYTSSSSSSAVPTLLSTSPLHVPPVHIISHIDLWTC